jgi:hypothetical protein
VVRQEQFGNPTVRKFADRAGVAQPGDLALEGFRHATIREARPHGGTSSRAPPAAIRVSWLHAPVEPIARFFEVDQSPVAQLPIGQRIVGAIHPMSNGPRGAANLRGEFAEINIAFEKFFHCRASI